MKAFCPTNNLEVTQAISADDRWTMDLATSIGPSGVWSPEDANATIHVTAQPFPACRASWRLSRMALVVRVCQLSYSRSERRNPTARPTRRSTRGAGSGQSSEALLGYGPKLANEMSREGSAGR